MVKEAVFPTLEPENRTGSPEGRELTVAVWSVGAAPDIIGARRQGYKFQCGCCFHCKRCNDLSQSPTHGREAGSGQAGPRTQRGRRNGERVAQVNLGKGTEVSVHTST